jgi:hypothetical protein
MYVADRNFQQFEDNDNHIEHQKYDTCQRINAGVQKSGSISIYADGEEEKSKEPRQ